MKISPVPSLFIIVFFVLLALCGMLHIHGLKGLAASGIGAAFIVWLSQPWWKQGLQTLKRPKESFQDPALGNRAKRRRQEKDHRRR